MWAASAGLTAYRAKKLKQDPDEHRVPLMGVLGAFNLVNHKIILKKK